MRLCRGIPGRKVWPVVAGTGACLRCRGLFDSSFQDGSEQVTWRRLWEIAILKKFAGQSGVKEGMGTGGVAGATRASPALGKVLP